MAMSHYGHRAIVIGSGIGGLAAAGALMPHFEDVVVLERDRLEAAPKSRPGTPQDRHPHGLLAGGVAALDELFPRFSRDLADAGAVLVRMNADVHHDRGSIGLLPRRDLGVTVPCASRPLIEWTLRRQVEASANITVRSGCRVTEIVPGQASAHGVMFQSGREPPETLDADLVIDASGRGALMLDLLNKLNWDIPETTEIGVDISYSTVLMKLPADQRPDWKAAFAMQNPSVASLNGGCLPLEGGYCLLTIGDRGPHARRVNWDGFLNGLRNMVTPMLHDVFHEQEPIGDIRHFGFPASIWRHYERLSRMPRGALPIGDAFCRFNPVYGQGMASAAQQARLLRRALDRAAAAGDPIASAQAFFMDDVGSLLQAPWSMSANADFAYAGTKGTKPERFEETMQLEKALFRAVVADPVVHRAFVEVMHLMQPRDILQTPDIKRRIEAAAAMPVN